MNRRDFLKILGAGAGAALASSRLVEALASPDLPAPLRLAASDTVPDPVVHLLNRITFGPRPGQADTVRKMGVQAYLEQQLAPDKIDDSASEALLGDYITLDMTLQEMNATGKTPQGAAQELISATILRAAFSQRQLFEVMVDFWSTHFSIFIRKGLCSVLKSADDRDVIRPNALGKFRDLLGASAKSPAMLIYLDNAESQKAHPNENYARELMELHTLGVGNYSEDDVKAVARAFTGWTIKRGTGEFVFRKELHDDGAKQVLGHALPAGGGLQDGETILDILAAHPATAQHIATKLCRRFIADDPPDSAVQAAAQAFTASQGDTRSVLRVILAAPEFQSAPPKFKRPFEYVISLLRALDAQMNGPLRPAILGVLTAMGQLPFDWPTPDGYNDRGAYWIGNMLTRWNTAIAAAYNAVPGLKIDLLGLAQNQGDALSSEAILAYFGNHLLGRTLAPAEHDAIWKFVNRGTRPVDFGGNGGKTTLADAVALLAASPVFQYR